MQIIDARGKECPKPVMMTKDAIQSGAGEIRVIVDNPVAGQNVSKLLKSKGFSVTLEAENEMDIAVSGFLEPKTDHAEAAPLPKPAVSQPRGLRQSIAVLISGNVIGAGDKDLGEALMKGFLGTLYQVDEDLIPSTLILVNEGVKLALSGSSSCENLAELQEKGCRILVCGSCINHFRIGDSLGVGEVSNMFDIAESLLKADKVLSF